VATPTSAGSPPQANRLWGPAGERRHHHDLSGRCPNYPRAGRVLEVATSTRSHPFYNRRADGGSGVSRAGDEPGEEKTRAQKSLRLLGTVGEGPDQSRGAWEWYYHVGGRTPWADSGDTWWGRRRPGAGFSSLPLAPGADAAQSLLGDSSRFSVIVPPRSVGRRNGQGTRGGRRRPGISGVAIPGRDDAHG